MIDSYSLFRGRREICITHNGETYRLRVTRNGRLILNK
ncbi:MAG: hemin uptake protein HemP [Phycisphaerae bacterium]